MWMPLLERQRFSMIFTIFVLVALVAGARGQRLPQCAAAGEYCQNHWDCCSNSCMSYLYRCMRKAPSYSQVYIEPLYPVGDTSLDNLLDQNFGGNFGRLPAFETPQLQNRFGIVEKSPPTKTVTQNGPTDLLSIVLQPQPNQQQQHSHSPEVAQHERLPNTQETLPAAPVSAAERGGSESGPVTSDAPPCKAIGKKCFRNEECCTQRCHGFLHQCVT